MVKGKSAGEIILYVLVFGLLLVSLVWGTILMIFASRAFWLSLDIGFDIFLLVFAAIGFVFWANAIHYWQRIKKVGLLNLIINFYNRRKRLMIATAILFVLFTLFWLGPLKVGRSLLGIDSGLFNIAAIPWIIGEQIAFMVKLYTKRFVPFLWPITTLLWVIPLTFQLIGLNYIGKLLLWLGRLSRTKDKPTLSS